MNIVLHAHHARVPAPLLRRAEAAVARLSARLPRAHDAAVRFAADGAVCRVEVTARVPRRAPLVAVGEGRAFDLALAAALERFEAVVGGCGWRGSGACRRRNAGPRRGASRPSSGRPTRDDAGGRRAPGAGVACPARGR
jgi:hypothetical protein